MSDTVSRDAVLEAIDDAPIADSPYLGDDGPATLRRLRKAVLALPLSPIAVSESDIALLRAEAEAMADALVKVQAHSVPGNDRVAHLRALLARCYDIARVGLSPSIKNAIKFARQEARDEVSTLRAALAMSPCICKGRFRCTRCKSLEPTEGTGDR